jgi:hypothetical protein
MHRQSSKILWPAVWVVVCAYLNCAGWVLSALHQLNAAGYAVTFLVGVVVAALARKRLFPDRPRTRFLQLKRRFSRAFPAAFMALAILALAGGLLHPPANYDGLAYREPRVLDWLAESRWHWISTDFQRLNVRACGFEWLFAPLFVFMKTDRFVFLINFVSFLLLPGLIFSLFVGFGIRPRAAWYWMWLLPSGYCFVLQAGSIANDSFAAVFALAAIVFAMRARVSRQIGELWISVLAVALLTGAKTSNLPMLLPWGIAILPSLILIWRHLVPSIAVGVVAAGCSFLPVAALNLKHCGDWSGQAVENGMFRHQYPVLHVTHNVMLMTVNNFVPPVFPMTEAWKRFVLKTMPQERLHRIEEIFEPGAIWLGVPDMQNEETAGLGFGVSLLCLVTFLCTTFSTRGAMKSAFHGPTGFLRMSVLAGVWISVLPLFLVSGANGPARYLAPQYGLLVIPFLLNQTGDWIRTHRWWRLAGMVVFLLGAGLLVVSPARPLWPARSVLSKLESNGHVPAAIKRAQTVYDVYGDRADAFAPLRALLPPEARAIGMVTFDDPETSLWRPFGSRRVFHAQNGNTRHDLDAHGITYVIINKEYFDRHFTEPLESWQAQMHAEVVQHRNLTLRAGREPSEWYLLKLLPGTKRL